MAQNQLSSSFGPISGGNAADSFVVISGAPGSVDEVALATIEMTSSTIECVHIGGVLGQVAMGPTGTLVVQDGGELSTNFLDLGSGIASHANLVVRGAGTRVLENSVGDPACADNRTYNVTLAGYQGTGSVLVTQGAELNNLFMVVGRQVGASGYVKIESSASCDPMQEGPQDADCSQLNLQGVALDGPASSLGFPAFAQIGWLGTGQLVLRRARARIALDGDVVTEAEKAGQGMNIARLVGSIGTVKLLDASKFSILSAGVGNDSSIVQVGRLGTGTLEIAGGSLLEIQGDNGFLIVARSPGSVGTVQLRDANSTLTVDGLVGLSRNAGGVDGGVSMLILGTDTVLNAGDIDARSNSTIFSSGTINVVGDFTMGGVFNPGFSPGESVVNGDVTLGPTGLLRLEILGAGGAGGSDKFVVNGNLICDDGLVEISLSDGATIDDLASVDLIVVSGTATGTADVRVLNEQGDVVASFDNVDVCQGIFFGEAGFQVQIDIKPGSSENTVNLGSNGVLSVAIISSATFDATTIDPSTVTLTSSAIRLRGNGTFVADEKDVNNDGLIDLVVQVSIDALELSPSSESALLTGQTIAGVPFQGSDVVRVVPDAS